MTFAQFRQQTLREFASAEWVDIRMQDIQVLEGPGYMVSTFAQRTLPHGEQGWRRLYWMRQMELWKIVGEEWVPQNLSGGMDYTSVVDKEIRDQLRTCAEAWDKGDLKTLLQAYDREGQREDDQGRETIGKTISREMDAKKANPYRADPAVRITQQGVTVRLKPDGQPARTMLFLPGNFDSWLIVSEKTTP